MTIHYNPKNPTALFTFRGTVVQTVARSYLWWCLFTIHCILVYLRETHPEYMEGWGLNWAAAQPTLSLATFFLVFYAGNCYSRFFEFHNHSVAMFGIVMEWAADTKLYFPDRLDLQWNLNRLVLAGTQMIMCMVDEGKNVSVAQYRNMHSNNLLSADEIKQIQEFNGFKPFLPMMWALEEVNVALGPSEKFFLLNFRGHAFGLRSHFYGIMGMLDQQVPFPYFHVLKLLLVISLLLMSSSLTSLLEGSPISSILVFGIVSTINLGLEAISIDMADPFGDDATDFDTDEMMRHSYTNCISLLRDENRNSLRSDTLMPDIGNPVTRQVPAKPARYTTIASLMMRFGDAINLYDWSLYTLDETAKTYSNAHSRNSGLSTREHMRRASFDPGIINRMATESSDRDVKPPPPGFGYNGRRCSAPRSIPSATMLPPPSPPAQRTDRYQKLDDREAGSIEA
mmetsp:Transcript_12800/g.33547  ORF Transcript_12800/g.33547 Transcript_12800/m.33547 type:complete len:454 (-) Transcript_12800:254-1615(-)